MTDNLSWVLAGSVICTMTDISAARIFTIPRMNLNNNDKGVKGNKTFFFSISAARLKLN